MTILILMGKRYDKKHRLLRAGETERAGGYYIYRWTSRDGKRHGITAGTLEELREKEDEIRKDVSDGIRADSQNVTVNDLLDIYTTVTKELKQREFGNFEEKMKQQKQEWEQMLDEKEGGVE